MSIPTLHRHFWSLLLVLAFTVFVAGCGKEEESPTEPPQDAPSIPSVRFKGPNTTSQDPYAQTAKTMAEFFSAVTSMWDAFRSLPATKEGNSWKWTYTAGGVTYTYTGTKQADGSVQWRYTMNGGGYNNWTALEGSTSGDGKSGSFKAYEENSTRIDVEVSWSTSASNVLTGIWRDYENGVPDERLELINNPDGSGELKLYNRQNVLTLRIVWQANGSGEWWTYSDTGQQTGNGRWT